MSDWKKIEALLFASGRYLSEDQIIAMTDIPKKNLKKALNELIKHYDEIDTSLKIFEEDGFWKMNPKEDFSSIVQKVVSEAELDRPVMETLAVIAYKNPVLQSEVKDIRGSGIYDHIKLLEDKGYVTREKYGRTYKLKLAEKFFEYFDVEGEKDIRALFKDIKKPDIDKIGNLEVYKADDKDNEFTEQIMERMKKLEQSKSEEKQNDDFLINFEKKLNKKKTSIDEAEKELDEYRPKLEDDDQTSENDEKEETENSKVSEQKSEDNEEFSIDKINKEIAEISGELEEEDEASDTNIVNDNDSEDDENVKKED
ncbi:SMC-Scp complex subunit ScpB [Candidatus Woesearchaeota archaeon]|nr:SMC-Scp complex subunit ScpB [Candidatus Woesearchaeota archaeon]MCF7900640.1 SMC-Scp complex subunit ScpB [Candidatus Woesearchaeota archaeon]MCF8013480.1 SMC-Scp complex subunit ScpB [Candidatus Woesearchaeota archaeon]